MRRLIVVTLLLSLSAGPSAAEAAFDIGPEVYSFKYEEPGLMEEEGTFYGLRLGYTSRDWALSSGVEAMGRLEARFAYGQVAYDGALQDGTPYTMDGIDDYVFEGRLLLGPEWQISNTLSTLYVGVGYRYLNDDSSFDPAGYERESNYYYVPIGYEIGSDLQAGWSLAGRVEYDYFLWGMQKSHVFTVVEKRQKSGHGFRASIRLQIENKDTVLAIEPFFRYWDIDDSEITLGWLEPANETTEIGISVIWMF